MASVFVSLESQYGKICSKAESGGSMTSVKVGACKPSDALKQLKKIKGVSDYLLLRRGSSLEWEPQPPASHPHPMQTPFMLIKGDIWLLLRWSGSKAERPKALLTLRTFSEEA